MRQFLLIITLVTAVLFPVFATAAETPDFSGTGVRNVAMRRSRRTARPNPRQSSLKTRSRQLFSITKPTARNRRKPTPRMEETRCDENVVRSTEFERELARLGACHRIHAGYKNPQRHGRCYGT